ncbi:metallophosphoesterase family protein [Pedobacter nanyangensis]|uniref:metallophosphoesterase family protein n=1 Tax=Pedobacter nanyangensis TaxID=1562389 RepID=UPI000DE55CB8|nr:metallophosphoesterase [Pedobacter nanyangensis]
MKKLFVYLTAATILAFGCNGVEFSPNQKFRDGTPQNVNNTEIAKLQQQTPGPRIRVAISSDTQRMYKEAQLFVDQINARNDIDFVILNGDISDFGQLLEFEGIYSIYSKLKVPFISIVGNHDLVANGPHIFRRMFGEFNFTFNYGTIKFVCFDSNSREYNFNGAVPDIAWLKANFKLDPGTSNIIAFSHVPPNDADFDPNLRPIYEQLANSTPGFLASFHAHQHQPDKTYKPYNNSVPFIITNAVLKRAYTILDISNGQIETTPVNF